MGKGALVIVLLAASTAVASPRDDAEAAITRGITLRRQGDDLAALEEFRRAQAQFASPRAAAQVGLALQAVNGNQPYVRLEIMGSGTWNGRLYVDDVSVFK